jgi:glycosyltransferase involved in cell wall biosynthesis
MVMKFQKKFHFNKLFFIFIFTIIDIFYFQKNGIREKMLLKGRKYLNKCLKGKLNKKFYTKFVNPRVTSIIPVYNCQNSIKQVVRSIQNQNMIDIEILLVNDKSKDDSLKIIENIQKTDKRIKIINNKKNMGTLYSRCIGALQAKGNYIFPLDNDDMFFDDDVFNVVYGETNNLKYDIVGFKFIQVFNNYKAKISQMNDGCHMHKKNLTIYQPNLSLFGISKNDRLKINDVHIWSKCIKNSIYKKAVNSLGKKRYSFFMSFAEDTSMVFVLFNVAESFKYISKYGIYRNNRVKSAYKIMPYSVKLFGEVFFLDVIFDFTRNDLKSKKFAVYKAKYIRNSKFYKALKKINISFFKNTLKKFIFLFD